MRFHSCRQEGLRSVYPCSRFQIVHHPIEWTLVWAHLDIPLRMKKRKEKKILLSRHGNDLLSWSANDDCESSVNKKKWVFARVRLSDQTVVLWSDGYLAWHQESKTATNNRFRSRSVSPTTSVSASQPARNWFIQSSRSSARVSEGSNHLSWLAIVE